MNNILDNLNNPDIAMGMTDEEMTHCFKEAVKIDNQIKKLKKVPIQCWDSEKQVPYILYSDGTRKY